MNNMLATKLDNLPERPGVYLMKDKDGNIIYIGKAKILKNRVRQYFQSSSNHTIKVRKMVEHIADIEYVITDSEVEALMLECNLIKQHRPYYNILMKDDKSYPYLMLTTSEEYPRLVLTRKRRLDKNLYFGPYVNAYAARQTLEAIKRFYPLKLCKKNTAFGTKTGKVCLQFHIGHCRGVCQGDIDPQTYQNDIEEIKQILTNRPQILIEKLRNTMQLESEQLHFETAAAIRDQIEAVGKLNEEQKISDASFDERDIIALATDQNHACIQMFRIRDGKMSHTETNEMNIAGEGEREVLASFLEQYYTAGAYIPREIILPFEPEDHELLTEMLTRVRGAKTELKVPKRGDKKRLLDLAAKNAAMNIDLKRTRKEQRERSKRRALEELSDRMDMPDLPYRIEAYDISNISGTDSVGVMVVFDQAVKQPKQLRRFQIRTIEGQNDIGSMAEVVRRRLTRAKEEIQDQVNEPKFLPLPEIIFVDGGIGHVNKIKQVVSEFGYPITVAGMVKDRKHTVRGIVLDKGDEITNEELGDARKLIYEISEEVHRAAIGYHQKKRSKSMLKTELEEIEGIGKKRSAELLRYFGSMKKIREAQIDQLCEMKGMNRSTAKKIYDHFHPQEQAKDQTKGNEDD